MNSLSLISSLQDGTDLPAGWQPGDQALPFSLEKKWEFLGLDNTNPLEAGHMGEPKIEL